VGDSKPETLIEKFQRSNGNVQWSPLDVPKKVGAGATAKLFLPTRSIQFDLGAFLPWSPFLPFLAPRGWPPFLLFVKVNEN
jgi:hypothetical protein